MNFPDELKRSSTEDLAGTMKGNENTAAVALIFNGSRFVIEKRISRNDDPWSGQFSLPGGHYSLKDNDLLETAIRETLEETGMDLRIQGKYLGHFGPFNPRNRPDMKVFVYVFEVPEESALRSSRETEYAKWIDISNLEKVDQGKGISFRIEDGIIWGMTARVLEDFLEASRRNAR